MGTAVESNLNVYYILYSNKRIINICRNRNADGHSRRDFRS